MGARRGPAVDWQSPVPEHTKGLFAVMHLECA
jgi:hypothetical protein